MVNVYVPEGHTLDGRYLIEAYPDGSGFFLYRPVNGRTGFVIAAADSVKELQQWARKQGAKSAEVL